MRALDRLPQNVKGRPELRLGLGLFYVAFAELNSCRQVGMGDGPIPWTDVHAYGLANGYDAELLDELHEHIAAMDAAYRKWLSEKRKADGAGSKVV